MMLGLAGGYYLHLKQEEDMVKPKSIDLDQDDENGDEGDEGGNIGGVDAVGVRNGQIVKLLNTLDGNGDDYYADGDVDDDAVDNLDIEDEEGGNDDVPDDAASLEALSRLQGIEEDEEDNDEFGSVSVLCLLNSAVSRAKGQRKNTIDPAMYGNLDNPNLPLSMDHDPDPTTLLDITKDCGRKKSDERGGECNGADGDNPATHVVGTLHDSATGEEYEGPLVNGTIRHGDNATSTNSISQTKFIGSYKNDRMYKGTLITPSFSYTGSFDRFGRFYGYGTLAKSDGVEYVGEFIRGKYNGAGKEMDLEGGVMYTGNYMNGLRHGVGTLIQRNYNPEIQPLASTMMNDGENGQDAAVAAAASSFSSLSVSNSPAKVKKIRKTMMAYFGGLSSADESDAFRSGGNNSCVECVYTYSGSWVRGRREGHGTEIVPLPKDETYEGEFYRDRRHGRGRLTSNGTTKETMFRGGHPLDGPNWKIVYADGRVYIGDVKNGVPHGKGNMQYPERVEDKKGNKGAVNTVVAKRRTDRRRDDMEYVGEFRNGLRHGRGLCVDRGGEEFDGLWMDDEPLMIKSQSGNKPSLKANIGENDQKKDDFTKALYSNSSGTSALAMLKGKNGFGTGREERLDDDDFHGRRESSDRATKIGSTMIDHYSLSNGASGSRAAKHGVLKSEGGTRVKNNEKEGIDTLRTNKEAPSPSENEVISFPFSPSSSCPVYRYENGDTFSGSIDIHGERQGYGVYICSSTGTSYDGPWLNDSRHGRGVQIIPSKYKYEGDFVHNKKCGQGTLIFDDGSMYVGQFVNGYYHGHGTLIEEDGRTEYRGEWKRGFRHGAGEERCHDGTFYRGEYKDNKRHGTGTLHSREDGEVLYSGSWTDGLMDGEGVLYILPGDLMFMGVTAGPYGSSKDDLVVDTQGKQQNMNQVQAQSKQSQRHEYRGFFAQGMRSGKGALVSFDGGFSMRGMWLRNMPVDGPWNFVYEDGSAYSGSARCAEERDKGSSDDDGLSNICVPIPLPSGFGTMKYKGGDVYTGSFVNGMRQGRGIGVFGNGDRWDGTWKNDSVDVDGVGVLTLADGSVHKFGQVTENLDDVVEQDKTASRQR